MSSFLARIDSGDPLTTWIVVAGIVLIAMIYGFVLMALDARAAKRELERHRAYHPNSAASTLSENALRHFRSLGKHP